MKAWAITEPGHTEVVEIAEPTPADGEVLIEVKRVGYCGSDLNTFRGINPLAIYPRIPGHELAGIIVAIGFGVPPRLQVGLVVTVLPYKACGRCPSCRKSRPNACRENQTLGVQRDGALTRFIKVPWQTVIWSEQLGLIQHTLVEPLSVGFHAVERGCVCADDTVLIFGSGMVGLGAISAAAQQQCTRVIAVDVDDRKLALAKKAGATAVINSRSEPLHDRLLELTDGDGPTVAIEAVGSPATFRAAVDEIGFSGRVVYIGYAMEPVSYDTKLFVMKELDIRGSRNATRANFAQVIGMLESGRYPVDETITATVPFAGAGAALAEWSANTDRVTKLHVEV